MHCGHSGQSLILPDQRGNHPVGVAEFNAGHRHVADHVAVAIDGSRQNFTANRILDEAGLQFRLQAVFLLRLVGIDDQIPVLVQQDRFSRFTETGLVGHDVFDCVARHLENEHAFDAVTDLDGLTDE